MLKSKNSDPSETVRFLAACVGDLDSIARNCLTDDDFHQGIIGFYIRNFLDAYQITLKDVVPQLSSYKRNDPVQYAGVSGVSYHEFTCRLAAKQYTAMFYQVDPSSYLNWITNPRKESEIWFIGDEVSVDEAIEAWSAISNSLAQLFEDEEPINTEYLQAGIETEKQLGNETANNNDSKTRDTVDPNHRTREMGLGEAAILFDLVDRNPARGIRELHKSCAITMQKIRAKLYWFDLRELPEHNRGKAKPRRLQDTSE